MTSPTSPTERVGRYQLLDPIGIGPSGTVSRAKVFGVAGFERQFAVKRFHAELTATAAMAAMLSAAARAYGSLEHPRIARMSEFGVAQGSTFTAVEYVHGLDALRLIGEARLAGVSLAAGGALALVSQAARAVGYAHGRGLTHLGLAPTNVIITAEGDIKITDFGILSATLPQRPIDVARLAQRIPYLAPEQLANEATSAATDVFALGVLAYELVTGNRTFKGETPQQIASAIMAGPPAEPLLPRPIVRVLQRCLARSPFERFPDARALADALDAALRVAPVPGTRKDIGAQVKDTLDRLAALNEGQLSGVVALHLGTGPIRRPDEDDARRTAPSHEPQTLQSPPPAAYELAPPDLSFGAPASPAVPNPAATLPDLPRPPMTVPGVAPPPIPVPPGVTAGPGAPSPSSSASNTLLGLGKTPPAIPVVKFPRAGSVSGLPAKPPAVPAAALRPRAAADLSIAIEPPSPEQRGQGLTTDSAIHPLDPGDLVPFDPVAGEPTSLYITAQEADASDAASSSTPATDEPSSEAAESRVGAADTAESGARRAAGGPVPDDVSPSWPEGSPAEPRPVAALTPATPLFDPIVRSMELPTIFNVPGAPTADEDRGLEAGQPHEEPAGAGPIEGVEPERAAPPSSAPSSAPPSDETPALPDPRLGKTILGYAAPRTVTPAPFPPLLQGPPGAERSRDEISELALEGFHAIPGAAQVPWQHEGSEPRPDEAQAPPNAPQPPPPLGPTPLPPAQLSPFVPSPLSPPSSSPLSPPSSSPLSPPSSSPLSPPSSSPLSPLPSPSSAPGASGSPIPPPPILSPQLPVAIPPPSQGPPVAPPLATTSSVPGWPPAAPPTGVPGSATTSAPRPRRSMRWILVGMVGAAVIGVGAWQVYLRATAPSGTPVAGDKVTPPSDASAPSPDATQVAVAPDATQVAAASDATQVATAPPDVGTPVAPGPGSGADTLTIASSPPGARVFLDGSDAGATPVKLPGSPDRHTIALLLAGHELYVAQVDGHGTFQIPLKEVTPTNGPAGIKVLRCKDKERYYVFVDGKPTGQTCPTERIGCEVGPHTVEVYDVVSETRRKWDVVVKDTRLSFRVRVE